MLCVKRHTELALFGLPTAIPDTLCAGYGQEDIEAEVHSRYCKQDMNSSASSFQKPTHFCHLFPRYFLNFVFIPAYFERIPDGVIFFPTYLTTSPYQGCSVRSRTNWNDLGFWFFLAAYKNQSSWQLLVSVFTVMGATVFVMNPLKLEIQIQPHSEVSIPLRSCHVCCCFWFYIWFIIILLLMQ